MSRPVVVGFGPAGMLAALFLSRKGMCPIILERGRKVDERAGDVEKYFTSGRLSSFSNVQFGEGGAGTFSDGKLYTGISDHRRAYVLDAFVGAGAPEEILYLSHPHIGTDRLRTVVASIREEILSRGGTFLFERTVTDLRTENNVILGILHAPSDDLHNEEFLPAKEVILAIGHSARDTFRRIHALGIPMEQKAFSVGVRIEHPQEWINRMQYGSSAGHVSLPPADYKLVAHTSTGRNLYTFCMCPGGFVVASASSEGQVVTNGMSEYKRDAVNANSALLVGVNTDDFGDTDALAGVVFQEKIERSAFTAGGATGRAPVQRLEDFFADRISTSFGTVKPSYRPGVEFSNLRQYLPANITDTIHEGIQIMNQKIAVFSHPDSLLTGFETRSSSPVRIIRDESLQSTGVRGMYPCGEGAGYAGGIMSSAIDGLRCAERIYENQIR